MIDQTIKDLQYQVANEFTTDDIIRLSNIACELKRENLKLKSENKYLEEHCMTLERRINALEEAVKEEYCHSPNGYAYLLKRVKEVMETKNDTLRHNR